VNQPATRTTTWTPERREKQRELAKRLHREGKLGGAVAKGGRPKKRAPDAVKLLRVIEAALEQAPNGLMPRQAEALRRCRPLARIAPALTLDREHIEALLVTSVRQLVSDGELPQMAVFEDDSIVTFLNPTSAQDRKRLRDELGTSASSKVAVLKDFGAVEARRLDDAALLEAVAMSAALTCRPLLHDVLNAVLLDAARQAVPYILGDAQRRT
jgi:hypothetical protein